MTDEELEKVADLVAAKLSSREPSMQQHYSVQDVAEQWGVSDKTVRRLCEREPDVLRISGPRQLNSTRARQVTLRIPAATVARMHEYWSVAIRAKAKVKRRGGLVK